jgi:hypothetical protein
MRFLLLALLAAAPAVAQAPRSVYTTLDDRACRTLSRHEETGGTVQRCPGTGGYALQVLDDDARVSVNVVAPGGRVHPLNYWGVVTRSFSSLGPRAEWRVRGGRPYALIVRVNANEDPDRPERITSYLAVARIGPRGSCVTDVIRPSADANARAQRAADVSAGRPCLRERP